MDAHKRIWGWRVVRWVNGAMLVVVVTTLAGQFRSGRVIATWTQPASVDYGVARSYTLAIFDESPLLLPGFLSDRYAVYIPAHGQPVGNRASGYGHFVTLPTMGPVSDKELKQSAVTWTSEGVTVALTPGHTLSIPKAMFLGGR